VPGHVVLHELDVRDDEGIAALAAALSGETLDVLIHNAGIKGDGQPREEVMAVNARAPMRVAEALLEPLARSPRARILLMSSQLGARRGSSASLGDYGDSKARLNDRFRERAPHWKTRGITAIVMHPGWVRTDMGGRSAPVSVHDSATGIRRVIDELEPAMHGSFLNWRGEPHPW
jgi:NAD(P)-dependent dehydrogenase (short-subunit alcohol dehydrogenase family)